MLPAKNQQGKDLFLGIFAKNAFSTSRVKATDGKTGEVLQMSMRPELSLMSATRYENYGPQP